MKPRIKISNQEFKSENMEKIIKSKEISKDENDYYKVNWTSEITKKRHFSSIHGNHHDHNVKSILNENN